MLERLFLFVAVIWIVLVAAFGIIVIGFGGGGTHDVAIISFSGAAGLAIWGGLYWVFRG